MRTDHDPIQAPPTSRRPNVEHHRAREPATSTRVAWAASHLAFLASERNGLIELRIHQPDTGRWHSRFVPTNRVQEAAGPAIALAATCEVYVGVLPRVRNGGRRRDLQPSGSTIWVDLDDTAATERARAMSPGPSLVVASGTCGHAHAYWVLRGRLPLDEIERYNRALAAALGGDPASCDAPRVLRLAGTVSHKRQPPIVLPIFQRANGTVDPRQLADRLGVADNRREPDVRLDAPIPVTPGRALAPRPRTAAWRPPATDAVRWLEQLPPASYVPALTGRDVGLSRKVRCPLHDDRTPSLHVYETAQEGWFCFGCRRGGSIYDLAAALWSRSLRGPRFIELRDDLLRLLAPTARDR